MYEYKVIPAPRKAPRNKGARTTTERFAAALQTDLNDLGTGGWSFVRAETLPVDERHGLFRKPVEEFHTVLIFRRPLTAHAADAGQGTAAHAQRHPKFFAEKPAAATETSAPALGAATEAGAAGTPVLRAERPPEPPSDDKPARKSAGKSARKPAASADD